MVVCIYKFNLCWIHNHNPMIIIFSKISEGGYFNQNLSCIFTPL